MTSRRVRLRGALPALLLATLFAGFGAQTAHAQGGLMWLPGPEATYTWPAGQEIDAVRFFVVGGNGVITPTLTDLPSGLRADITSTGRTIHLRGTPDTPGTYPMTITVTVSGASDTLETDFTIIITGSGEATGPVISIAAATSTSLTEGATAQFTVSADTAPSADLAVAVAVTQSGSFISGTAPTMVTIPANQQSVTLSVPTADDSTDEPNGSITATLSAGTGYRLHATDTAATVQIVDNDAAATSVAVTIDSPIAGDDFVNFAEWFTDGFSITGTTEAGAAVSVTLDGGMSRTAAVNGTTWTLAISAGDLEVRDGGPSIDVVATATISGRTPGTASGSFVVDLTGPTADWLPLQALTVGVAITAVMPTGSSVRFEVMSGELPAGLSLHPTTGVISGTPTTANAAQAGVVFALTDRAGNTGTQNYFFPPVGRGTQTLTGFAYSAGTAMVGGAVPTVTAPGGAVSGSTLSYATSDSAVCTVNANTGALTLVGAGSCVITVTASGTANYNSAEESFTITVSTASTPTPSPTVTASGTYAVAEDASPGANVGAALTAGNFPGSGGTWSITAGNTGTAFRISNAGQIQVAGSLDHETTASYTLTVQFMQGGETAATTVTVTVTDVNEAPEAVGTIDPVTADAGSAPVDRDVAGNFSDPEEAALTYMATSGDTNVATVAVSGSTVTITPVAAGSATITVTARDPGGLTTTGTFTVTVRDPAPDPDPGANAAPPPPLLADQDAGIGIDFSYAFGAVTDPDGDSVAYAATQSDGAALPGWLTFTAATRTFSGRPAAADAGTITVRVTAIDDGTPSLSSTADFDIVVAPPSLTADGPYRVAENAGVGTLVGAPIVARHFPPGTGGTWSITGGNTGDAFGISAGQIMVAAALDRGTVPSYSLSVSFSRGLVSALIQVTVEVTGSAADAQARADRISGAVLPRMAQAVVSGAGAAIGGRIDAAASGAASPQTPGLAGRTHVLQALKAGESGLEDGATDLALVLGGSSFVTSLGAAGDSSARTGGIAVWGAGDYRRLSGPDGGVIDWDGNLSAFHLGADVRARPDLLAGVSVSRSRGAFDYTDRGGDEAVTGSYDSRMNAVHPYVGWSPAGGPRL